MLDARCNGCQTPTMVVDEPDEGDELAPEPRPARTADELEAAGWRVDELAATAAAPASRLYYCPRCAVELDHSRPEEIDP